MKHVLASLALLLMGSTVAVGQTATPAAVEQQSVTLDETRAAAGRFKDALQTLEDQLNVLNKLSATDRMSADRVLELQTATKADILKAEGALNRMSGADSAAWTTMKSELNTDQEALSTSIADRHKVLEKAFGTK